jgi:hypothetical protein
VQFTAHLVGCCTLLGGGEQGLLRGGSGGLGGLQQVLVAGMQVLQDAWQHCLLPALLQLAGQVVCWRR